MQLIISIIIIATSAISIGLFGVPQYNNMKTLKEEKQQYVAVLENAKTLEQKRTGLIEKSKNIDPAKLTQLEKMLPDNPENVSLILELDQIANKYGLTLQNVKIEDIAATNTNEIAKKSSQGISSDIGTLNINFSVVGTYINFTDFIRATEKNLRIIDVQKISFATQEEKEQYQYTLSVRTYWLK